MYAPKFPKKQTEGFFIIVSRHGTNELVALKRVGWPANNQKHTSSRTSIRLPQEFADSKLHVSVISDGYIGLEWPIEEVVIPPAPQPDVVTK
jgi:antiviral helicase SLH1